MVLGAVDALSDDDPKQTPPPKTGESKPVGKAKIKSSPKPKAKTKAKGVAPKVAVEPKPKENVDEPEKPVMKRPAAASGSMAGAPMKRPAGRPKDPDHISTSKSRYPNGVYCIKLFGKEVIRVSSLHLACDAQNLETVMYVHVESFTPI